MIDYAEWQKAEEARLVEKLPGFVAALEAAGIEEIIFYYEGEGDEGSVHEVEFVQDGLAIVFENDQLEHDLTEFAHDLLTYQLGSWGDGNGGQGTLTFDVAKQTLTTQHSVRVYTFEDEDPITWPPTQGESSE